MMLVCLHTKIIQRFWLFVTGPEKKFHKCNVLSKTTSLVTSIFHHLKVHTQSCLDNAPLVSIGGYALRVRIPHWIMKHYTENVFISLMLWSRIIYGHRTASISPKIVRFYGARTAPGRRQEESYDFFIEFSRHRTVPD